MRSSGPSFRDSDSRGTGVGLISDSSSESGSKFRAGDLGCVPSSSEPESRMTRSGSTSSPYMMNNNNLSQISVPFPKPACLRHTAESVGSADSFPERLTSASCMSSSSQRDASARSQRFIMSRATSFFSGVKGKCLPASPRTFLLVTIEAGVGEGGGKRGFSFTVAFSIVRLFPSADHLGLILGPLLIRKAGNTRPGLEQVRSSQSTAQTLSWVTFEGFHDNGDGWRARPPGGLPKRWHYQSRAHSGHRSPPTSMHPSILIQRLRLACDNLY